MNKNIKIELTENEALVLFDWVKRFNEEENKFEDQSEQRTLWDLESILEKKIPSIFFENYKKKLIEARNVLRDEY